MPRSAHSSRCASETTMLTVYPPKRAQCNCGVDGVGADFQMGELMNGGNDGSRMGTVAADDRRTRGEHLVREYEYGRDNGTGPGPVRVPHFPTAPLTTPDFAEQQRLFTTYARLRVLENGHREYAGADGQKFERLTLHQLVQETLEECADIVNYAVMLAIQVQRLQRRIEETL